MASATQLFAANGYQGASVRDICNLARANPGAVSYHFGGKRQLYRAVLRQAALELLSCLESTPPLPSTTVGDAGDRTIRLRVLALHGAIRSNPLPARLVLRDLADGGAVAVEALAPALRTAVSALQASSDFGDPIDERVADRLPFLELAAPVFLINAAWPVLEGAFELVESQRDELLGRLLDRVLARPQALGSGDSPSAHYSPRG
jgi:AcrR family transcriptional regulator